MIERLTSLLREVAADAASSTPPGATGSSDPIPDLLDALRLVADCPQLRLDERARRSLAAVTAAAERIPDAGRMARSGDGAERRWLGHLARQSLAALQPLAEGHR